MRGLASREEEIWSQVVSLVGLKKTTGYDEAVQLLAKLAQLAAFRKTQDDFRRRVRDLRDRYKRLSGFQWRVEQANAVQRKAITGQVDWNHYGQATFALLDDGYLSIAYPHDGQRVELGISPKE
jgi:pullulanase/glycogen debranching enzyme